MINLSIDCTDVISKVTYIIVKGVEGRGGKAEGRGAKLKHHCSALVKINVDLSAEFTLKKYSTYCTISENYCHSASRALDVRKTRRITTEPQLS